MRRLHPQGLPSRKAAPVMLAALSPKVLVSCDVCRANSATDEPIIFALDTARAVLRTDSPTRADLTAALHLRE